MAGEQASFEGFRGRAAAAARHYGMRYDWVDVAAIEACLSISAAYSGLMSAFSRYLATMGETRRPARNQVLRLLHTSPNKPLSQNEISRELGVTPANVTYLVASMEKEGLLSRYANPDDRRSIYVELTEAGERLAERIVPATAKFMAEMLEGFSEEDKQTLNRLLDKFRKNTEAKFPPEPES